MNIVDHPGRDAAALNIRIRAEFGAHPCWKAESVLEDLLVLEFGNRQTLLGKRGPVTVGELRVSVQQAPWFVVRDGKVVVTSDQMESEASGILDAALIGRELRRIDWAVHCSLIFSDDIVLRCDRSGSEDIVELRFANNQYVDCFADGAIQTEALPEA